MTRGERSRREVLVGGGAVAFLVASSRSFAESGQTPRVTTSSLGIVADGVTDVARPLAKALASGAVVDGEGGAFAVRGDVPAGPGFRGLVNARLTQLDPAARNRRTLAISDAADFVIENVSVRRGGTGSEHPDRSLVSETGGVFLVRCRNFAIRGLRVGGGGIGTGIAILYCQDFTADDLRAGDLRYRLDEHPTDDAIQGVWIGQSERFAVKGLEVEDIGGADRNWTVSDNNRGLAIAGCRDFSLSDLRIRRVGQGVDLSGSGSNERFRILRSLTEDCYSWGFKFANGSVHGLVEDCVSRRPGIGGFVVTGPGDASNPMPGDIRFQRCLAEDVTGAFARSRSFGFGTDARQWARWHPRGVVFEDCVARAGELHCCMKVGFRNDVPEAMAEGRPNRVVRCRVEGPVETPFVGF